MNESESTKLNINEFLMNIAVFIKLKCTSNQELLSYFKTLDYPCNSLVCLKALTTFWSKENKLTKKNKTSIKNVSLR